jgi:uncharacterized protein (TIGR03437 family)
MTVLRRLRGRPAIALLFVTGLSAQQYVISTVAGGALPITPAVATSLAITPPAGITVDSEGNVFFSSIECVFRLDRKGILTRVAGQFRGDFTGDGRAAESAQLSGPAGLTFDSSGNLFVADSGSDRVRKISTKGIITTVAGNGGLNGPLGDGGPAIGATIASPAAVAVDTFGNLFISERSSGRVRKVSPDGIISTIAGGGTISPGDGGPATSARLLDPTSLAIDGAGNLFIADLTDHRVRKVSTDGTISTVAGTGVQGFSGDGGAAAEAELSSPRGVMVDASGNVFIADSGNYRVREVTADGVINTVVGGGSIFPGNGVLATKASLFLPSALTLDADGNLYIAAGWIQKISPDGMISIVSGNGLYSFSGDGGPATRAQLFAPSDVAIDGSGDLFIADSGNCVVRKVTTDGTITTVAGSSRIDNFGFSGDGGPATNALLAEPSSVAVDEIGNLFIADTQNNRIRKVSQNGIITTVAGNGFGAYSGDHGPATKASLNYPSGIAVDRSGNLFITDYANNSVRKVSNDGIITTVAGNGSQGFSGDGGPATSAQLFLPRAVAVDENGNLFISDTVNARVRKVSLDGIITTVAGNGAVDYSGEGGLATSSSIHGPAGLAVDSNGNLFVAETLPFRIHKVSSSGIITTIAGTPGSNIQLIGGHFVADGWPATNGYLSGVVPGLRVDSRGRVFLAESDGSVRMLQPTNESSLIGSVVDAASQSAGPISPGEIIVIYGAALGPDQLTRNQPANGAFSIEVNGTTVSIGGISAPVLSTSYSQVSAIVPYTISGPSTQITVAYQDQTSPAFTVPVAASSPSIFSLNGSGAGQGAAVNADGSGNDALHPVSIGGYLSLYATGAGQTAPESTDGKITAITQPLPQPVLPTKVTVDGQPARVVYAGAAPAEVAGMMQVVVQIPSSVKPGGYVPVVLQVGDLTSVEGAIWIAVSAN